LQQAGKTTPSRGDNEVSPGQDSAHKHVSGAALFVDDYPVPGDALHAYVALSETAHGRISSLDLSRVRSAKGVVDVLVMEDIPGNNDIGQVVAGDPVMVDQGEEVAFSGQVLFAVAATSHSLARKAARLAGVTYEPLPTDITIEEGLARQSFLRPAHVQQRGNAAKAIADAGRKLTGQLHIGGQEHLYLECQVSMCVPEEDGGMLVYSSTQSPTDVQRLVAAVLDVPMSRVTVDVRRIGGGFGGKETHATQWACIAALLARKTGRTVKIRLSRSDDMAATGKRHSFLSQFEVGFDETGRIDGLDIQMTAGCGYSADLSDAVIHRAMFHVDNAYYLPAVKVTGRQVKTNIVSSTAFRGFGAPQAMLSIESIIDNVARATGKDPLEVRKLNFYAAENERDITHYGQTIDQHVIRRLVDRLEETADYQQRRREIEAFNASNPVMKKGLSLTPVKFGIAFTQQHLNQAGALLHIHRDGSIEINHGGTEMGQGLFTKVAQVIAQEFKVDFDTINCTSTRTDKVPNTSATAASTGSDLNGMAARNAALKIRKRMIRFAAKHFEVDESEVSFADNQLIAGATKVAFPEFVRLAYENRISLSATGYYRTPKVHYDQNTAQGRPFHYFVYGAAVSEVLIDSLTGEYKVSRVDICEDVGLSLNPILDRGQIEGGFIQGMGWLTTEELVWDKSGHLESGDLATYKIPTAGDVPHEFIIELLPDSPNTENSIYHSKAVGEPPLMLAISVWCALRDAIASIADYRFSPELDAPATPERVYRACQEMRGKVPK
jgi:xanthine dehydrogenase large subunit